MLKNIFEVCFMKLDNSEPILQSDDAFDSSTFKRSFALFLSNEGGVIVVFDDNSYVPICTLSEWCNF